MVNLFTDATSSIVNYGPRHAFPHFRGSEKWVLNYTNMLREEAGRERHSFTTTLGTDIAPNWTHYGKPLAKNMASVCLHFDVKKLMVRFNRQANVSGTILNIMKQEHSARFNTLKSQLYYLDSLNGLRRSSLAGIRRSMIMRFDLIQTTTIGGMLDQIIDDCGLYSAKARFYNQNPMRDRDRITNNLLAIYYDRDQVDALCSKPEEATV
jgi:hypothetical protein